MQDAGGAARAAACTAAGDCCLPFQFPVAVVAEGLVLVLVLELSAGRWAGAADMISITSGVAS